MTIAATDVNAAIARATSAVTGPAILDALRVLMATPSPPGREKRLAESVAAWGRVSHPDVAWDVDPLDDTSANLFARSVHPATSGPSAPPRSSAPGASAPPRPSATTSRGTGARELALYGHLDTSLTGEAARDFAITGQLGEPAAFRFDEASRTLRGFGVGVAKAPSSAGTVAFLSAAGALRALDAPHRLTLLLAAGGTHRAAPSDGPAAGVRFGRGVAHALDRGWRPTAILNVKGGPRGVLHEEPATAYMRVRLRTTWSAALARRSAAPEGGLVRHAGAVLDAIERWREMYLAAHPPVGQLASEVAIGAIRGGLPEKPDLLPGLLEVFVYAVLPPDEDPVRVARELATYLRPLTDLPGHPSIEVELYASAPGGTTDPSSEIIRLARDAWAVHAGSTPEVTGWTGATDGGLFHAADIPTVRMGPGLARDATDPRIETLSMDELVNAARAAAEVAVRYFAAPGRRSRVGA